MIAFFLAVAAGYVAIQLYIYWKLRQAAPARGPWRALAIGWLTATGVAFFTSRLFEAAGWRLLAVMAGLVSHWWVAASMWLVGVGLVADAWNLAVQLASRARLRIPPRTVAGAGAALVVVLSVWAFFEPWAVELRTVVIHAPQLPPGSQPIRIVQLSDLHLNALMNRGRLARIIARVREAQPDIVVFTGDFADESSAHVTSLSAMLADIQPPLGKLAATGNHEFYRGLARSLPLLEQAGFRVLRGQCVCVAPNLLVAGVDDGVGVRLRLVEPDQEDRVLPPRDRKDFVILLKHRPDVEEDSVGRFDLQLSSHTHGGQVFPARLLLMLFSRYTIGRYNLGGGSSLYVTRGAGTFGAPMRLLSPPEVTLIILQPPS